MFSCNVDQCFFFTEMLILLFTNKNLIKGNRISEKKTNGSSIFFLRKSSNQRNKKKIHVKHLLAKTYLHKLSVVVVITDGVY